MSEVLERVDKLSPERRALLQKILRQQAGPAQEQGAIRRRKGGGPAPLSFAQERLWFIDRLEPGSAVYNLPVAWRLTGALDQAALERALGEIVRRHEALRTVFTEVDGSPVQVIAPFGGFALPVEDLSGLDEAERETAARRRATEEATRPFDLSAGPLFRAALLRLGAEDHVLLLSMHHVVSDGWSMGVLYRELSALYAAFREGGESPLPELPVQYADYAVWQRERLQGEVLERQLSYWREHLAGAPELLELPTDRPRPPVQTFRGTSERIVLPGELLERLQALGRSEDATLFMVVLAAFQVLLSKYSGSEDIVVGTPIAGRTRKEVEDLIGFFVNTLVLRTDLSGDPGFREALRRAREVTLGAYEHQEVPFERLVAELRPERSMSHTPLFQVMFSVRNAGGEGAALPGLEVSRVGAELASAKFDLSLVLTPTSSGVRGGLTYSTDLFERGTVVRMLGHLARVLEQVTADPEVRLSRIRLLDETERALVLEAWNRTGAEHPDRCIHELFQAQAARTPGAVAVVDQERSLTYAELDARANRLAHHLRTRGVEPEARVAIQLPRSIELVVAELAILKAGAAYVPIDPGYPAERVAFMLDDSGARLLLTTDDLRARVAGLPLPVVSLSGGWSGELPVPPLAVEVAPAQLAYVVYTSGSTGRPKGVAVTHRGLANLVAWHHAAFGTRAGERATLLAGVGFDASAWEVWPNLCAGATLHVVPDEVRAAPEALRDWLAGRAVETCFLPTPLAEALLFLAWPRGGAPRTVLTGGDRLHLRPDPRTPFTLVNNYGPTENTVVATSVVVPAGDGAAGAPSIGRPVANTRAYLLDAALEPVPVGAPGELYVGGVQVARGYLGRPGLTAERFVPDPFGREPGARMYRTGDLGRWLPDGTIDFLRRNDHQVKVRGFRIEPGEIEARLLAHPQVREAAVVAHEGAAGDRRLVAYWAGADGVQAETLRAHLSERLPTYMVPSAFVEMQALPVTSNGKLDRRALPEPERVQDEEYAAPRTPVEEVLAGIYADVLKRERVGAGDDFFALGGHSLLATRVISRVRAAFGVELALRALFEASTVRGLAEQIVRLRAQDAGPQAPPILPVPRDGRPLPLSFAQQRLWFVDRLQPGRVAYNMPSRMRVRGVLDLAAIERALSEVVRRHESLRTRFPMRDGEPVQQVDPAGPVPLPVVDLGELRGEAREAEMERLAAAEARRPFDLAAGPLLRGTVLRLADDDAVVLLTLHHIVSDGWSMGILVRELSTLYGAFSRGEEARLPDLPIQYADYAVWQREWLRGGVLQAQIGYWRARLVGAPALLELPTDRPRPLVPGDTGASVGFTIGAETATALRQLSRREGATLFMTLLAAWQLLLSRYSGQEDVVVGSPIAGRNRLETEGLIGFFINTLVLRADLSGDPSFGELLHRVRESTLGAYQHQELPFEKLVEELGVERSQAYTPLFQVMFILQNQESSQLRLGDAVVEHRGGAPGAVKFDLSLSLHETGEEIRGVLSYRTELWMKASIQRMVEHYRRVLQAVAAHPERKLSRVALLGDEERAQLLAESSAPGHHLPEGMVQERFERQVARTPDVVALVLGEESLTYGELNRGANRLARHLRGRGVGPEVRVAVFLERSFEMVAGVLAILKAGGAYVPLDPSYPADRLAYQVRDSGATLLVTTRALLEQLGSAPAHPVLLDREAGAIARESDAPVPCAATPDNLAYVVYTSGSTGRPKGVMVPHRGVVSYLASVVQEYGLGPGDVVLQRSTLSFDASVRDLLGPLTAGARVVLVHTREAADPVVLLRRIREHRVSAILAIVPSVLRPLLDAAEEGALPPSLRLLLVSGEPLAVADCHRARHAFGSGLRVVNLWGATECTLSSSFHTVGDEDGEGIAPVGVPIPDTRIHVLDGRMEPVPRGVAGEAYIAGIGITRGYQNQPGLTAERFLPDPFGAPGARIYRVGDRVRRRADGALEFLGRVDQQVKVRGIRVETGEVEAVLRGHPGVREAVVVAREAAPGETRLVAYVTGEEEALAGGALRNALERTLPAHMIPSVLVRLEEFPLLPNGKVDRAALPAPVWGAWRDGQGYVAPSTATERVLAGIWESLLDVRPVGVDDHFFRLGGHSMLAVRLMAQIRGRVGVEVPLSVLFEHPTIRGLAARIEGEPRPRPWSPLVAIQPHGDRVPIFFVHPVGGEVLCYADLARELGPEQPFYGLQAGDLVHLGEEEASIEEMAARYVAAIREVRPAGPYLLGGWSFGGFVAFEMAQQLTRAGEPVPLVAMLDTRAPGEVRPADLDPCIRLAGMARAEARAAGKEISLTADDLRPLDPDARIARTLDVLKGAGVVPNDVEAGWRAAFLRGLEVRMRSAIGYQPRPYPGRIAMFVPSERNAGPEFRPLQEVPGWEAYVSEPPWKQSVPGGHDDMVRGENAGVLATHLRAAIEESLLAAHAEEPPSPRAAHPWSTGSSGEASPAAARPGGSHGTARQTLQEEGIPGPGKRKVGLIS